MNGFIKKYFTGYKKDLSEHDGEKNNKTNKTDNNNKTDSNDQTYDTKLLLCIIGLENDVRTVGMKCKVLSCGFIERALPQLTIGV